MTYSDIDITDLLKRAKSNPSEELESDRVEFKGFRDERALHNSKDLAEEISAIANHEGGIIVVGVRDSSDVTNGDWISQMVGIAVLDEIETQERLQGKLRPRIKIRVSNIEFEATNYVVIDVPHRSDTLVSTASGKTCIREGRSSRPMEPSELENAVKSLTSYDWSAESVELDPAEVIEHTALNEARNDFCHRRELTEPLSDSAFLEAIGATKNGRLLKSGVLFLGSEDSIRKYLGDFEYRFSWKKNNGQLIVNDVWSECLWYTVKRAKHHFKKCNIEGEFDYDGEKFMVPLLDPIAFHEAFLNALVHRDYTCEGMVSVTFENRQILISSPGRFYGGVTADNIVRHEPRHRNKALARMLMTYHLVDRAGMGVLRMGLKSLMYGRGFPHFREDNECVEVTMQGEYLRPAITVLARENEDTYGIPELLILNSVYESGFVPVNALISQLSNFVEDPWLAIQQAVALIDGVELCGNNDGVFVRVTPARMKFFSCTKLFRVTSNSKKHVDLFTFLMMHKSASSTDVHPILGAAHQSYTSRFLADAKYTKRTGHGASSRWSLI